MTIPNYCIIEPGTLSTKLVSDHGSYADMGLSLLRACLGNFNHEVCSIVTGERLPEVTDFDGYLIMGSEHGVNDDLPWIEPLLTFIAEVYAEQLPMAGICFGHQAIAQALGGEVRQTDWNVGVDTYRSADNEFQTIVYHQDQVMEIPSLATVEYLSDRCPNAVLQYTGSPCWSTQSHPEFQQDFAWDLFEDTRYDPLTDAQCDRAKADLADYSADLSIIQQGIRQTFAHKA